MSELLHIWVPIVVAALILGLGFVWPIYGAFKTEPSDIPLIKRTMGGLLVRILSVERTGQSIGGTGRRLEGYRRYRVKLIDKRGVQQDQLVDVAATLLAEPAVYEVKNGIRGKPKD